MRHQLNHTPSLPAALYEFRVPESLALGSAVGVIRAMDADIGENAEMEYRVTGSEGPGVFDIVTNQSSQEGWLVLRKVGPTSNIHQWRLCCCCCSSCEDPAKRNAQSVPLRRQLRSGLSKLSD